MSTKLVFRIAPSLEDMDREIVANVETALAAAERGDSIEPKRSISFESWDAFFRTMTPNRIAILEHVAAQEGVASIRALAKALDRDYAAVHADVTELLKLGLLDKDKDGNTLRCEVPEPVELAA